MSQALSCKTIPLSLVWSSIPVTSHVRKFWRKAVRAWQIWEWKRKVQHAQPKLIVSKHSPRRADRLRAKNWRACADWKTRRYSQPAPQNKSYLAPPNGLKNESASFPGRQVLVCLKVSLPRWKKTYWHTQDLQTDRKTVQFPQTLKKQLLLCCQARAASQTSVWCQKLLIIIIMCEK